jgi:hypothetical protein
MALCGISNQITPDNPKPQRMGIQIGPKMAFIWIADEHVKRAFNVVYDAVCCSYAVLGDVFPNLIEICECFRMK